MGLGDSVFVLMYNKMNNRYSDQYDLVSAVVVGETDTSFWLDFGDGHKKRKTKKYVHESRESAEGAIYDWIENKIKYSEMHIKAMRERIERVIADIDDMRNFIDSRKLVL
ncbi:MAG: hypothetical protein GY799_00475 [Desulfobulbaceae bacterium]|nr:hypothetical protein [Desulfobulbaceae bacterium]